MARTGPLRRAVAAGACAGLLALPSAASAQEGWFDLEVPGALEEILGQSLPFEGPRLLRGLIDLFHGPESATARQSAETFRGCLDDLQRLRTGWLDVEREAGEVSLAAAGRGRDARRALERFLDVLGLRLERDGPAPRVAPDRDEARRRAAAREAAQAEAEEEEDAEDEPAQPGCAAGTAGSWPPEDVERRLNAGEAIAWDLPHFAVSLPLSPRLWLAVLYRRDLDGAEAAATAAALAAGMLARVVTEPGAARLYTGLAALDGPTLTWLAEHPRLQSRLYEEDRRAAFADFGRALRVRDGRVATPGGAESAPFWEDLVGASVSEPERFAERLFAAAHLAYAYDVVARLPAARQRFVLGTWRSDARARRDGLRSLRSVFRGLPAPTPWFVDPDGRGIGDNPAPAYTRRYSVAGRAAARAAALAGTAASAVPTPASFGWEAPHAADPAAVLRAVVVDDSGAPAAPASLAFWTRVFSSADVPAEPDRRLERIEPRPRIDAAYLLAAAVSGPPGDGRARVHAIAFVQRVFADHDASDLAPVFTAARAFGRYPMLMLSVERMGVADPRVYAALARAALRIDRVEDPLARRRLLSLFQGALALVEQARLVGSLSPDAAGRALGALAELQPARSGGFGGALAAWLGGRLLPELGVPVEPALGAATMDERLLAVLAGVRPGGAPAIEWEGLRYRFDRGAAAFERLRRARTRLGSNRLDTVMVLAQLADELAEGAGDVAALARAIETLEASTAVVRNPYVGLPGVNARVGSYASEIESIVRELRRAAERRRPDRIERPARDLRYVIDVLLADLLRTLAYVVHLANAYETDLLGSDVAARHDFGVHLEDEPLRARAAWLPPWGGPAPPHPFHVAAAPSLSDDDFGTGWRVYGSLLSLDLAFAQMSLVSVRAPSAGQAVLGAALTLEDRHFLALAVPLFNPGGAAEAGPARIAAAVRRGRDRVQRLAVDAAGLRELADAVGMDGARRNEMGWMLRRRPEAPERFFTRAELFRLGAAAGEAPPAGWGAPALPLDGCLCVRMPDPYGVDLPRAGAERLAATFVDLHLALAEAVDDLGLPAPIVADLLPFALGELLESAEPASTGDVADALTRHVRELSRQRIEDYVAMQVGPGLPLRAPELPRDNWR